MSIRNPSSSTQSNRLSKSIENNEVIDDSIFIIQQILYELNHFDSKSISIISNLQLLINKLELLDSKIDKLVKRNSFEFIKVIFDMIMCRIKQTSEEAKFDTIFQGKKLTSLFTK